MCSTQSAYAPMVPSPLNPAIFPSNARNNVRGSEMMSTSPPRMMARPMPVIRAKRNPGPSEKLLRRKAAEAWRMEALHRQVVEYEKQALGAILAKGGEKKKDQSERRQRRRRASTNPRESAATAERTETAGRDGDQNDADEWEDESEVACEKATKWHHHLFKLPAMGFLAPKKLAKSLRFVRVLVSLRVRRRHKADRD